MKTKRKQNTGAISRTCQGAEKLCNVKVTFVPIVIGAFGAVSKSPDKMALENWNYTNVSIV